MIPMFYILKSLFLLWAMLPQTNGAKLLYDSYICEKLDEYNYDKLSNAMLIMVKKVNEGIQEVKSIDNKENTDKQDSITE